MARAIFKAVIVIGDIRVPVKLYSAVEDRTVRFHLLHDQDMARVKQRMVNPETGDVVEVREARRGLEVEPGRFVVMRPEELEELEPQPSRTIRIERFIDPAVIEHQWYERPYWLGPDGDEAAYWALAKAIERRAKEGLARWVMRKKEYLGVLRVDRGYLALVTIRHADEVIPTDDLEPPAGRELDPKELRLAEQLVAALEGPFEPETYRDEHRERVLALIETKAQGGEIELRRAERKPARGSLASLLEASLAGKET